MTNTNEIRPLCLSFRTPPAIRPQAILIGKMIPEWLKQGIKPVILTCEEGDWDIGVPLYKLPNFQINRYLARIPWMRNFFEGRYFEKIFLITKEIVKKHSINIVFSFSNPQASNILGAMLKDRLGIKFISHFSDPWHDNPNRQFSRFSASRILEQERFIMEQSDRIIFVAKKARDLVMKKYPPAFLKKSLIIPHCFNQNDYPQMEKTSDQYIISHVGAFYKQRNPEVLFMAIKKLLSKYKNIEKEFKVRLVGALNDYIGFDSEDIKGMIERYDLENIVELIGVVNYKKSLEYMKLSDCLVVIDANFPNSPFLTSKVVDYAGSGRTIIGITPDNSPTVEFLSGLGYRSFNYEQVDELADYICGLIRGTIKSQLNKEYLGQFNVEATTAKLIGEFGEVLNIG